MWELIEQYRNQARHHEHLLCEYLCCAECYLWDPGTFGRYGRRMRRRGAELVGMRHGRQKQTATRRRWVRMDERDGLWVCNCGQKVTGEGADMRVCPRARYRGGRRAYRLHQVSGPHSREARIFG